MKGWFTMAYIIIIAFIHTQHTIFYILCTVSGIQWMLILILCTHTIVSLVCAKATVITFLSPHTNSVIHVMKSQLKDNMDYKLFHIFDFQCLSFWMPQIPEWLVICSGFHSTYSPFSLYFVEFLLFRFSFLISIDMNFGYYVWEFHEYSSNFVIW